MFVSTESGGGKVSRVWFWGNASRVAREGSSVHLLDLSQEVLKLIFDAALPEMALETVCELSQSCKMLRELTARWRCTLRALRKCGVLSCRGDDLGRFDSSLCATMWHSLLWDQRRQNAVGWGAVFHHTLAQATLFSELRTWAHPGVSYGSNRIQIEILNNFRCSENVVCWYGGSTEDAVVVKGVAFLHGFCSQVLILRIHTSTFLYKILLLLFPSAFVSALFCCHFFPYYYSARGGELCSISKRCTLCTIIRIRIALDSKTTLSTIVYRLRS